MARVLVAPTAIEDLDGLIFSRHLPSNTRARVKARLSRLSDFPRRGSELEGRWKGFRYVLGPWSWMLIVYTFDEEAGQVSVVTIQDARSANSSASER
jgi:mRNA-degrading endonuclease RelE of RelBE toxin-antitoxin system